MPIFDQGYQHWQGALAGHSWRWLAITRHGIRTQVKGRYVRLLLIMAWMPALTLVGVLAVWGLFEQGVVGADLLTLLRSQGITEAPQAFRQAVWALAFSFFFQIELYFILLLVTLTGPNLISLDLRYNALPLYLSRPVSRLDYFLGKLGVIAALVAAVAVLPAAAAYLLGVCFSLDLTVVRDTWRLLPAGILYGLLITLSAGTLILALSSLSRRSLYVGLTWFGLFLVGSAVVFALVTYHRASLAFSIMREHHFFDRPRGEYSYQRRKQFEQQLGPEIEQAEAAAGKTDWLPLFSYTANLDRLGKALLNTDAAWVEIGRAYDRRRFQIEMMASLAPGPFSSNAAPAPVNERRLADSWVPQFPWTWSAAVLAALFGLSLCILSTRVKSLDRLR
jgi:ABC-2 type transport system permease protein